MYKSDGFFAWASQFLFSLPSARYSQGGLKLDSPDPQVVSVFVVSSSPWHENENEWAVERAPVGSFLQHLLAAEDDQGDDPADNEAADDHERDPVHARKVSHRPSALFSDSVIQDLSAGISGGSVFSLAW